MIYHFVLSPVNKSDFYSKFCKEMIKLQDSFWRDLSENLEDWRLILAGSICIIFFFQDI